MSLREKFEQENWVNRIMMVEQVHMKMIVKYGHDWNIRKTCELLGKSLGLVCEDLKMAKFFRAEPELMKDCKNREEAWRKVKDK